MLVQGRPAEKELSIQDTILGLPAPLPEPRGEDRLTAGASERMRRKRGWLSKFAGWSGHAAALIALCPEFGSSALA